MQVRNPLTGELDYEFQVSTREDVAAACAASRAGQPDWLASGVAGRASAMRQLWSAFEKYRDALHTALARDTGRQAVAHVEIAAIHGMIELAIAYATEIFDAGGEQPSVTPGIFGRRQLVPHALVGIIAPWNFPIVLSMVDAVPALMAGCAVVLKPSEVTQRYVDPLRDIIEEVPAIASVLRIVRGPGSTGADLIDHVDAVVCTGSVATGRVVAEHAASRFIPAFLELGGKDAAIVTCSADIERAATAVLRASVLATGQACQSLERVYVDAAIYEPFLARLLEKVSAVRLTCDDPTQGHIGPFIMGRQADVVRSHIEDAVAKGARVEFGGRIVERGGRWCEPTILTGVNHTMRVMREETFGPVIPLMPYRDLEEAIRLANDGDYGLSANVFAGSEEEAQRIAERLDAGFISINDSSMSSFVQDMEWEPSRLSGLGRSRMGRSGVSRYLRTKAIAANRGPVADVVNFSDTDRVA